MSTERVYVVEVRKVGSTEWRPAGRPYLSKAEAEKKAERVQWEDKLEARVCIYAVLDADTKYRKREG